MGPNESLCWDSLLRESGHYRSCSPGVARINLYTMCEMRRPENKGTREGKRILLIFKHSTQSVKNWTHTQTFELPESINLPFLFKPD